MTSRNCSQRFKDALRTPWDHTRYALVLLIAPRLAHSSPAGTQPNRLHATDKSASPRTTALISKVFMCVLPQGSSVSNHERSDRSRINATQITFNSHASSAHSRWRHEPGASRGKAPIKRSRDTAVPDVPAGVGRVSRDATPDVVDGGCDRQARIPDRTPCRRRPLHQSRTARRFG
jgi:hypothetical protein